jgi:hypothetical protein
MKNPHPLSADLLSTPSPATLQHIAAVLGLHPLAEAMNLLAFSFLGLIRL